MCLKNKIRMYRILAVSCWIIWTAISLLLFIAGSIAAGILGSIVVILFAFFASFPVWDIENKIDKLKKQLDQENASYILTGKYR